MNLNCIGFYYIKESSGSNKKENKWIKAQLTINAQIDRYMLEVKPVTDDEDIYDEDEDERIQRLPKIIRLTDYKSCEPRGCQNYNDFTIHLLGLIPKLFSKAKKLLIAFFSEEIQLYWYKNIETILTHKFFVPPPVVTPSNASDSASVASVEPFMIENDVYEGSMRPGEFLAAVIENKKSKEIELQGRYILEVTEVGIELKSEYDNKLVKSWDIKNMRRFGENDNVFSLELGKFCEDGQGYLTFKVDKGKQLIKDLLRIKDNCLKKRNNRESVIKQPDSLMYQPQISNEEIININLVNSRHTLDENFCENLLYDVHDDFKSNNEMKKRMTTFEPPKLAPPPIPLEIPKRIYEQCE